MKLEHETRQILEKRNQEYIELEKKYKKLEDTRQKEYVLKIHFDKLENKYEKLSQLCEEYQDQETTIGTLKKKIKEQETTIDNSKQKARESTTIAQQKTDEYNTLQRKYDTLLEKGNEEQINKLKEEIEKLKDDAKTKKEQYENDIKIEKEKHNNLLSSNEKSFNQLYNVIHQQLENADPTFSDLVKECEKSIAKANEFQSKFNNEVIDHKKTKSDNETLIKKLKQEQELEKKHFSNDIIDKLKQQNINLENKKREEQSTLRDQINNLKKEVTHWKDKVEQGQFERNVGTIQEKDKLLREEALKITQLTEELNRTKKLYKDAHEKATKAMRCCDVLEKLLAEGVTQSTDVYNNLQDIINLSGKQVKASQDVAKALADQLRFKAKQKQKEEMDVDVSQIDTANKKINDLEEEIKKLKNTIEKNKTNYETTLKRVREEKMLGEESKIKSAKQVYINKLNQINSSIYGMVQFIENQRELMIKNFNNLINNYSGSVTQKGVDLATSILDTVDKNYESILKRAIEVLYLVTPDVPNKPKPKYKRKQVEEIKQIKPYQFKSISGKKRVREQEEQKEQDVSMTTGHKNTPEPQENIQLTLPSKRQKTGQERQPLQIDINVPEQDDDPQLKQVFDPDVDIEGLGKYKRNRKRKLKIPGLYES